MAESDFFPLEFDLQGTPVSAQSKSARHRESWKSAVAEAARQVVSESCDPCYLELKPLAVTIYVFPAASMAADIDNVVKPILDAMKGVVYVDDRWIERLIVQKFEPNTAREFRSPSERLAAVLASEPPLLYIRVDDDLSWRVL